MSPGLDDGRRLTFGVATGMTKDDVSDVLSSSLPPIAGIILIVGAGGGVKQTLVDTGIGELVGIGQVVRGAPHGHHPEEVGAAEPAGGAVGVTHALERELAAKAAAEENYVDKWADDEDDDDEEYDYSAGTPKTA